MQNLNDRWSTEWTTTVRQPAGNLSHFRILIIGSTLMTMRVPDPFPSTPVSSLQALTGIHLPHHLLRNTCNIQKKATPSTEATNRYKCKWLPSYNTIPIPNNKVVRLLPTPFPRWTYHSICVIWDLKYIANSSTTIPEQFETILNRFIKQTCCHTDCSKTQNLGGAAYLIDTEVTSSKLPYHP